MFVWVMLCCLEYWGLCLCDAFCDYEGVCVDEEGGGGGGGGWGGVAVNPMNKTNQTKQHFTTADWSIILSFGR